MNVSEEVRGTYWEITHEPNRLADLFVIQSGRKKLAVYHSKLSWVPVVNSDGSVFYNKAHSNCLLVLLLLITLLTCNGLNLQILK